MTVQRHARVKTEIETVCPNWYICRDNTCPHRLSMLQLQYEFDLEDD